MKLIDYFNAVNTGEWINTEGKLSWRIENGVMYFQCSNGKEDWRKNFDILPALIFIKGVPIITQRGWAKVWKELKPILDAHPEVIKFVGYSHGGVPATQGAWYTGKPAICFGCPNIAVITGFIRSSFASTWYISTSNDIVMRAPPWLGKYGVFQYLPYVDPPDDISPEDLIEWFTGHPQSVYRAALKLSEAIYDSEKAD